MPKKRDPLLDNIVSLLRGFKDTQRQGRALGLFVEDRGLLECPRCGLQEDVAFGGAHLVTLPSDRGRDTGLRFYQIGGTGRRWRCPKCRSEIKLP